MTVKEKVKKMCTKKGVQFSLNQAWMDSEEIDVESLKEALDELRKEGCIKYSKTFDGGFTVHPQKHWLEVYEEYCSES